ncbi:hypothetical protein [Catellatospora tritici]|uniref:hypothetical protein n=1 Tax=Catellatospora tritici TaxID=2851566 RepID=UPI001C2CD97F|nr:hypothetical protein [Catellatospora tritici]MBV1853752.1 hypothetical protein [Catellatospora tritici]
MDELRVARAVPNAGDDAQGVGFASAVVHLDDRPTYLTYLNNWPLTSLNGDDVAHTNA